MNTRRIFVNCRLSRGSFSGELIFDVDTTNGVYNGIAPLGYCHKLNGETFAEHELVGDMEVAGKLVARLVAIGDDYARVSLPDQEAVIVAIALVSEREPEIPRLIYP